MPPSINIMVLVLPASCFNVIINTSRINAINTTPTNILILNLSPRSICISEFISSINTHKTSNEPNAVTNNLSGATPFKSQRLQIKKPTPAKVIIIKNTKSIE